MRTAIAAATLILAVSGCGRLDHLGRPPSFSSSENSREHLAMAATGLPRTLEKQRVVDQASLWSASSSSLLGDPRASNPGDILTVVIQIDEKAEISNSTSRSRSADERMQVPELLGLPQRIDQHMPEGASMADAVELKSKSESDGDGSVRRKEKLTLRIAATVTDLMPSGVLRIEGSQEVRVNYELRELLVSGYVRPEDISRNNEITYDKIASARISYGGRGQISDFQQPRWGQQIADIILPF
ncbi:MAG: flagellar basal body L-ring protein FlgH [Rhodobacteraceae bacterium]|nr:flagellar basal body L-ring protein FlgH [Paracoccaceae bacterium]